MSARRLAGASVLTVAALVATLASGKDTRPPQARYVLTNPLAQVRPEQVVELPLPAALRHAVALQAQDAGQGHDILPVQRRAASDRPDVALVLVDFAAGERKQIVLRAAAHADPLPADAPLAQGRFVPERKDDFAWENDRTAFRMYGPALEPTGGVSSGIDVWAKKVRRPIIDAFYAEDSYHVDHGLGMDFYDVGKTRGCGGLALQDDGQTYVSRNFTTWRRLANGPLRVVFELDYAPWGPPGRQRAETKRIALDVGSNFMHVQSRFSGQPGGQPAIGIAGPGQASSGAQGRWLSVWGKPHGHSGSIGCGVVMATPAQQSEHDGQFWLALPAARTVDYFAGAAWSGGLDYHDATAWRDAVARFQQQSAAPIQVRRLDAADPG